jgi:glutamate-1-semialdehyde 2,1-aminomutase
MSEEDGERDEGIDGPAGRALWARADAVLPGGAIYVSRSADFAGRGNQPGWIASAEGARVTDVDGRRYIDLTCANGPMLLGYRHPEVEAAAARQAAAGDGMAFFPPVLVDWIERLLAQCPDFDWGVTAKNGSDVVSLAVRIARRATERPELVTFERAWHGFDAELAVRPDPQPGDVHRKRLPWNDAEALAAHLESAGERTAAILVNPLDQSPLRPTLEASPDFVAAIAAARERHGVRVIVDDVRHGLRLHEAGSHRAVGLEADLLCLGKAIGNGHAVSALLGAGPLRAAAAKLPFTASHAFGAVAMTAGIATLDVYAREDGLARLTACGRALVEGLRQAAELAGQEIEITGPPTMPTLRFTGEDGVERGRAFARAAAERGALLHPTLNWFLALAHDEDVVEEVVEIADAAFQSLPATRPRNSRGG